MYWLVHMDQAGCQTGAKWTAGWTQNTRSARQNELSDEQCRQSEEQNRQADGLVDDHLQWRLTFWAQRTPARCTAPHPHQPPLRPQVCQGSSPAQSGEYHLCWDQSVGGSADMQHKMVKAPGKYASQIYVYVPWGLLSESWGWQKKTGAQMTVSQHSYVIILPAAIHHATSVSSFKSSLKTFLFSQTFCLVPLPWGACVYQGVCVLVCGCVWVCMCGVHVFAVCIFELLTSKYMPVLDLWVFRAMYFRLGVPNVHNHYYYYF